MHDVRMTLTKAALAEALVMQLGLNKREAKDMVERFFEEICGGVGARRFHEVERFRELHPTRETAASRAQPEDGSTNPDLGATRGDLSPQFEA